MSSRRSSLAFMLILLVLYSLYIDLAPGWNVESRWACALAMARNGTTAIDEFIVESEDVVKIDHHLYSAKAPGISLICAPLVWLLDRIVPEETFRNEVLKRWLCRILIVSFPGALLGMMFLRRCAGHSSAVAAACCCIGSPVLPYASVLYGHVPAAFILSVAWRKHTRGFATLAGILVGCAILIEYPSALAGVLMVLVSPFPNRRALGKFLLGLAPALIIWMGYNLISFGTPIATGYSGFENAEFQGVVERGVAGFSWPSFAVMFEMLFGGYRGFLLTAPWGIFWLIGVVRGTGQPGSRYISLVIPLAYIVVFSGFSMWWGGASCCMRHLIPVIPFMAFAITRMTGLMRGILAGAGMISTMFFVGFLMVGPETPENFSWPFFNHVLPRIATGRFRPSLMDGDHGLISAIVALFLAAAAWTIAMRMHCRHGVAVDHRPEYLAAAHSGSAIRRGENE